MCTQLRCHCLALHDDRIHWGFDPLHSALEGLFEARRPALQDLFEIQCDEWSATPRLSSLFGKGTGAFAGLLKNAFENLKLFGVGIGKYSPDFRGMLAEDWNNQVFTAFCKSDDPYPPIVGAFRPADESFFEQAIDRHADRAGSEMDLRPDGVHRQRTLMEKRLKHTEVRVGNSRFRDSSVQIVGRRLVGFAPNQPAMHRV
jgi:hypothetical protein